VYTMTSWPAGRAVAAAASKADPAGLAGGHTGDIRRAGGRLQLSVFVASVGQLTPRRMEDWAGTFTHTGSEGYDDYLREVREATVPALIMFLVFLSYTSFPSMPSMSPCHNCIAPPALPIFYFAYLRWVCRGCCES
jgi:hypothetical protein